MTEPVRIPADVDIPDRVLGRLTARQVVIVALAAGSVYGGWWAGHVLAPGLPPLVYAAVAVPLVAVAAAAAFGRRDGIHAEVLARAAIGYRLRARHLHTGAHPHAGRRAGRGSAGAGVPGWASGRARPAPGYPRAPRGAPLRLPARAITTSPASSLGAVGEVGLVDLGPHGWAVIAAVGTVAVGLRGPDEQHALIGHFAHWLHSLSGPAQILVRAQHLDLGPALEDLATAVATVGHPALAAAAADHHDWLAGLASRGGPQLLTHQVLIVLREPAPTATAAQSSRPGHTARTRRAGRRGGRGGASGAAVRLAQRLLELDRALAPAEITVTPLDPHTAAAVLATTADPARPPTAPTPSDTGPHYHPRPQPDHNPDHGDARRWAA